MADGATAHREVVLETDRLVLTPWRVAEPSSSVSCGSNVIHECHRTASLQQRRLAQLPLAGASSASLTWLHHASRPAFGPSRLLSFVIPASARLIAVGPYVLSSALT